MNRLLIAVLAATAPCFGFAGPVNINSADAETIAAELNGVGVSNDLSHGFGACAGCPAATMHRWMRVPCARHAPSRHRQDSHP